MVNLWNFAQACPLWHIDVATWFNDKEKNATAHLLRQIHSHMHIQPQSQGLCGVTKATKTQELIIVIAVDSGIQTHTQSTHMDKHTEQLSINPRCYGFVSMDLMLKQKLTQLLGLMLC